MHRAYLAAPIFNKNQLNVVASITQLCIMHDFKYFSPYEASQSIWKGRAPKDCSQEERDLVLRGNIVNLAWADTLVAWVGMGPNSGEGRTDTGVVWEMGYFKSIADHSPQRQAFTLAYIHPNDTRQHMNLMLAGTVDAVAYGQAQLSRGLDLLSRELLDACREELHPDKHLLHEKTPIV